MGLLLIATGLLATAKGVFVSVGLAVR